MRKISAAIISLLILPLIYSACSGGRIAGQVQRESTAKIEGASGMADFDERERSADKKADSAKSKNGGGKGTKDQEVKTWKRSEIMPNTSRLMIGDREELPLIGMQAKIHIQGFRARVIIDCYFQNTGQRQYEGTFKLRLPNDASPYFFAFGETAFKADDIPAGQMFYSLKQSQGMGEDPGQIMKDRQEQWSRPKEARVVPKEKAAFAYQETVRRQVDPALMEWSGAGIFSARVFPLMPQKVHRVVIGYDVNLLPAGGDLEYRFDMPKVKELVVDIEIDSFLKDSQVSLLPATKGSVRGNSKIYRYANPQDQSITVRFRDTGAVMLTGADEKTAEYFAMLCQPKLPKKTLSLKPGKAVFLVDVSLSSNPDRFNIWVKLLEAILKNNKQTISGFAVLFFNIEQFWWKDAFTDNTDGNIKDLMAFAGKLSLEGATDIKSALETALKPAWLKPGGNETWNMFLLSDGSVTWGETNQHALSQTLKSGMKGSLYAYRTGLSGTDTGMLAHLTRESGGSVFSIVGEAEIEKASVAHGLAKWNLIKAKLGGHSDILLAGRPVSVFPGQTLLVAGRKDTVSGKTTAFTLTLRNEQGETMELPIPVQHIIRSSLAPRAYGEIAVEQLEEFTPASESYSKAYATHFRITGKTCSMVMLESESEYLRYNIKPEEDAYVIAKNPVSAVVEKIMQQVGESLGDPKVYFLTMIEKMKSVPGITFNAPQALLDAVREMPRSSFNIDPQHLICKIRTWDMIPPEFQVNLKMKKVEYDIFSAEAMRRYRELGSNDALKAISSLAENSPGDGVLIRDIGYSAMEWGLGAHAYHLFRSVAESRPYEPQTYHAMALLLTEMGKIDLAIAYFEVGLAGQWQSRFGEFRKILLVDYLNLLNKIKSGKAVTSVRDYAMARLDTLSRELQFKSLDLMISIMWNTDSTDVDLHVIEPSGEECYYGHRKTRINGMLTQDVTQGYGPEMYVLQNAAGGTYRIRAKYFASNRNLASARTKVYATIYENWGTKNEKVTRRVITLEYGKEMHDIGTVTVKNTGSQDSQM